MPGTPGNRWYWYAYHGQGGRAGQVYAGNVEDLTVECMRLIAALTDHVTQADRGKA